MSVRGRGGPKQQDNHYPSPLILFVPLFVGSFHPELRLKEHSPL